jgi:hypothetical protein
LSGTGTEEGLYMYDPMVFMRIHSANISVKMDFQTDIYNPVARCKNISLMQRIEVSF